MLGAIGGVYLSIGRIGGAFDARAAAPTIDPVQASARAFADARAATAAADAAKRAKKAEEVSRRAAQEASRSKNRTTAASYPVPTSCKEYSGNRALGCALLLQWGFGLDQMPCLDKLWTRESGWNHLAQNRSTGAYGIPQALPGDKMAKYGSDWRTNPIPQIKWGLDYIKNRYQTPCNAWAAFQQKGWY